MLTRAKYNLQIRSARHFFAGSGGVEGGGGGLEPAQSKARADLFSSVLDRASRLEKIIFVHGSQQSHAMRWYRHRAEGGGMVSLPPSSRCTLEMKEPLLSLRSARIFPKKQLCDLSSFALI